MTQTGTGFAAPTIPGPIKPTRTPRISMPKGACDTHAHLFGPQEQYPYDPKRRYTPPDATLDDYIALLNTLGIERGVLVQASVYMTDNTPILDALAAKKFPLRGVVAVDASVTDAELERMNELGVCGVRLNLRVENGASGSDAVVIAKRIARFGWHMVFRTDPADFLAAEAMLSDMPLEVVIDHIGAPPVAEGLNGNAFQTLLRMVRAGKLWVKLSAPMRITREAFPYADVTPFVRALVEANPDRMIWATDWPHTTITTPMPDDGDLCDLLLDWIPDEDVRQKVLVDNPARLYRF